MRSGREGKGAMRAVLWGLVAFTASAAPANATLISVTGPNSLLGGTPSIIGAPGNVKDAGAYNFAPQGFDEVQSFVLTKDLAVDHGIIAAGTEVSSHMIFFNNSSGLGYTLNRDIGTKWTFDGDILGVMSDVYGRKEIASSSFLGAAGTIYPTVAFYARGLEPGEDSYSINGNVLTLNTHISQPGDWIRVVTASGGSAPVPEPMSLALVGSGMLAAVRARKRQQLRS